MDLDQLNRLASTIIFAGVIIALILLYQDMQWGADLVTQYPLALEYYPAFLATSIGVLLALVLEEAITASKRENRISALKKILEKEMQRIHSLVKDEKKEILYTPVWDSMVNSGDVSYLPTEMQDELFDIYTQVKSLNHAIERRNSTRELYGSKPNTENRQALTNLEILVDEKNLSIQNKHHKFLQSWAER